MNTAALILIDIQNIYFTEGGYQLYHPENAARNAAKLLQYFRQRKQPIIHVKHLFEATGYQETIDYLRDFHHYVTPMPKETVIEKHYPSAFLGTKLQEELQSLGIRELVIGGMMTHMCIDTTVRASQEYGYPVTLIEDACTTKALSYHSETIAADLVHKTFIASLQPIFAKVMTADTFISM